MKIKVAVGDFKIGKDERDAINDVLDAGRISEGKKVREFERKFASYVGTKYCIALNSGTSALIAGLNSLFYLKKKNIRKKTKVITSPITYIATTNAIVLSGLEPVYVDIDKYNFSLIPEQIEYILRKSSNPEEYSLILPVHLMGYPCDMDSINKIASKYNLLVFEDSAQSHGSINNGRKTGSLSLLSAFSFYIAHNIQAGEMGAVATDNKEVAKLVRKLKANGRICDCSICTRYLGKCPYTKKQNNDNDPRFLHDLVGYNFKTTEFSAALALTQLENVEENIKRRLFNVKYLNDNLKEFSSLLQLPIYSENVSYLAYPIIIKKPDVISSSEFKRKLENYGVETRPLFGCIPLQQPAYSYLRKQYEDKLPNAKYIGENAFYVGCHQYITKKDLDYMVNTFYKIIKELGI